MTEGEVNKYLGRERERCCGEMEHIQKGIFLVMYVFIVICSFKFGFAIPIEVIVNISL